MWEKVYCNCNYSINENGIVKNDISGHIKSPYLNKKNGYLYVDLYEGNKSKKCPIHRLMATAFIPNPENKPTVDHKDGNRQNNSISNLRWASYSEQNSRFNTNGVRSQRVKATHYKEERKKRGGGHISFGEIDQILFFNSISECAEYFDCSIGNITLRNKDKKIGLRGRTRAWLIEYIS